MKTAHEILNIPKTASREDIRLAYRELAKRWHPDRFMEGPERDWANEKMAEINAAYRECLNGPRFTAHKREDESAFFVEAKKMIDQGQYSQARKLLMSMSNRSADWNYLFGRILFEQGHLEKARIYLSIAAHQKPEDKTFAEMLMRAEKAEQKNTILSFIMGRKN